MWTEREDGECYWVLVNAPGRAPDHLRVWAIPTDEAHRGWYGDLVLDGEYLDHFRVGPFRTAEEARAAVHARARHWAADLISGLLGFAT